MTSYPLSLNSTGRTDKYNNNLLQETYGKGSHFVLGTLDTTYVNNSDAFLNGFLESIQLGDSIEESIQNGLLNAGPNVNWPTYGRKYYYPIYYIGDVYQNLD